MIIRKISKVLGFCVAGLVVLLLLLMLALKLALDRAPRYEAEIKEWVHAQTGYHIGFARVSPAFRWYGPELYFDRLELRSKDDRRVLARAAGGRVAAENCWPAESKSTHRPLPSRAWVPIVLRWPRSSNWAARIPPWASSSSMTCRR